MSDNRTQLDSESLSILHATFPASVLWVVLGVTATVNSSLLIITLILARQQHKSNFHRNIANLALADLFVGLSLCGVGIKRIYCSLNEIPSTATPLRCSLDQGAIIFGMQASVTQTLCLSTDRLIAVLFPMFYRNELSPKVSQLANIFSWIVCFIVSCMGSIVGLNNHTFIPACTQTAVYNMTFFQFFAFLMLFYSIFVIAEYAVIVFSIRVSLSKAKKEQKNMDAVKAGLQLHILASLQIIVCIYIFTWLAASAAADLLSWLVPVENNRLIIPYLIALSGVNSAVNFPIYLWKIDDIRQDFLKVFHPCKPKKNPSATQIESFHP